MYMYIDLPIFFSTVLYTSVLDCFISCATNYKNALVLGWMEKTKSTMRTYVLCFFSHHAAISCYLLDDGSCVVVITLPPEKMSYSRLVQA
jgi:hypothetical protein